MCGNSMRALEALRRAGAPVSAVEHPPRPGDPPGALGAVRLADDPAGLRRRRADRRRRHRRGARGVRRPGADARGEARPGLPRRARGEDAHRRLSSRTSRTANTGSVASTISAAVPYERLLRADRVGDRADHGQAERDERDRAEHVVGVDAREHLAGDLLLHGRVPADREDLEREAGDERGERDRARRPRACRAGRAASAIGRTEKVASEEQALRAGSAASAARRRSGRPTRRRGSPPHQPPAEVRVRLHRAEHEQRTRERGVHERELEDDRPQPACASGTPASPRRARGEVRALLADDRRAGASAPTKSAPRPNVAASIAIAQPGADADDEDAAERRADAPPCCSGPAGAARSPAGSCPAAPSAGRSRPRPGRRRRTTNAVQGRDRRRSCQSSALPVSSSAASTSLRRHAREVRPDHDRVPRQAVGPDAADEDEDDLRDRPRGEHEAEVALRAGHVQHRERERDRRHRVAEERHRPACEEQPELAVAERA